MLSDPSIIPLLLQHLFLIIFCTISPLNSCCAKLPYSGHPPFSKASDAHVQHDCCIWEEWVKYCRYERNKRMQLFFMCKVCASNILVGLLTLVVILCLQKHIFTFSTSYLKLPTVGASYFVRIMPGSRLS